MPVLQLRVRCKPKDSTEEKRRIRWDLVCAVDQMILLSQCWHPNGMYVCHDKPLYVFIYIIYRYVNCKSMAERSIQAVRNGDLKILPEMHESTWYRWLENIRYAYSWDINIQFIGGVTYTPVYQFKMHFLSINSFMIANVVCRDWCVSRQLWWGHRIPAYFVRVEGEDRLDKNHSDNNHRWVVARTQEIAREKAAALLNIAKEKIILDQDEDVLDTWFRYVMWCICAWHRYSLICFKLFIYITICIHMYIKCGHANKFICK